MTQSNTIEHLYVGRYGYRPYGHIRYGYPYYYNFYNWLPRYWWSWWYDYPYERFDGDNNTELSDTQYSCIAFWVWFVIFLAIVFFLVARYS